eukprot:scaffold1659_cov255-Pinguiococcus_pyrenoidosus.AAC.4
MEAQRPIAVAHFLKTSELDGWLGMGRYNCKASATRASQPIPSFEIRKVASVIPQQAYRDLSCSVALDPRPKRSQVKQASCFFQAASIPDPSELEAHSTNEPPSAVLAGCPLAF